MAKVGRPTKFGIRLTPEERTRLEGMIHCGKGPINSALKARILLKADVSENGPGWSDERIADALETSLSTVFRTRRQFVEEGLDAALSRKKSSWSPPWIFDEEAEAKLIALACSEPPQGYTHWTMQMLEKRVVELGIVEKTSDTTILRVLRRNEVKPQKKYWVIPPKAVSDFVAAMEETLKIYTVRQSTRLILKYRSCLDLKVIVWASFSPGMKGFFGVMQDPSPERVKPDPKP